MGTSGPRQLWHEGSSRGSRSRRIHEILYRSASREGDAPLTGGAEGAREGRPERGAPGEPRRVRARGATRPDRLLQEQAKTRVPELGADPLRAHGGLGVHASTGAPR